jgi:hypothetical protein
VIFAAKNEENIPSWKLVLSGDKTVTRRLKPIQVGKIVAVQPGRRKKAVCYVKVKSCVSHLNWIWNQHNELDNEEAHKEGFQTAKGLLNWFEKKGILIEDTWRIEFELITSHIRR